MHIGLLIMIRNYLTERSVRCCQSKPLQDISGDTITIIASKTNKTIQFEEEEPFWKLKR